MRDVLSRSLRVERLASRFRAWHHSDEPLDDYAIDRMLGFRSEAIEARLRIGKLLLEFGDELLFYDPTPYTFIRSLFRSLKPEKKNVFYDLGSGYGRVLMYGGLISQATFRGIEVVPQRVAEANRVRDRLNLRNVEFVRGNAPEMDFDDGDLFFFYNPFFKRTLREVSGRLKRIASQRAIRIASVGRSSDHFGGQDWLTELTLRQGLGLRFFASRT
jgi:SAM-dependent methyltransferase